MLAGCAGRTADGSAQRGRAIRSGRSKTHGKFFQLGPDLNQESFVTQVEFQQLKERVRDDELRQLIEEMVTAGGKFTIPTSLQQVEAAMDRFKDVVIAADTRLGVVLRTFL